MSRKKSTGSKSTPKSKAKGSGSKKQSRSTPQSQSQSPAPSASNSSKPASKQADRNPRLGRGLSSLMAVNVHPPTEADEPPAGAQSAAHPPVQRREAPVDVDPGPDNEPEPAGTTAEPQGGGEAGRPTTFHVKHGSQVEADPVPQGHESAAAPPSEAEAQVLPGLQHIPVGSITPNPHQPRQSFDEASLSALAASIKADGMMQPVVVRRAPEPRQAADGAKGKEGGGFELVAGERRWRASQRAGLDVVPALVRELDERQVAEWALIENLQREDLNPMDRAEAFAGLTERFVLSHDEIAARVGVNRSSVSNLMRLLDLCEPVRQMVRDNLLSMGQARSLASLPDPTGQAELARRAVKQGLSVRKVETAVKQARRASGISGEETAEDPTGASAAGKTDSLADLEKQISEQLGSRVKIRRGKKKGTGTLQIDFFSLDHFESLLTCLNVHTD